MTRLHIVNYEKNQVLEAGRTVQVFDVQKCTKGYNSLTFFDKMVPPRPEMDKKVILRFRLWAVLSAVRF
jgi:hypothetical protein